MKDIFRKIEQMVEIQKAAGGEAFASSTTRETWYELLQWVLKETTPEVDFQAQMLEVAGLAVWAMEMNGGQAKPSKPALPAKFPTLPAVKSARLRRSLARRRRPRISLPRDTRGLY